MTRHRPPLNKKSLYALAAEIFGKERGGDWMSAPNILLNGKFPAEVMHTTEGRIELERILNSIQYGGVC